MGVKLEERVRFFRKTYYKIYKQLYRSLHSGQQPEILFITCGDSRILPHQLLHAIPGELFILRNAGNIVPPYSSGLSEVAGIEFALKKFPIKHIIICGHSQCGAMQGALHKETLDSMPVVRSWLDYAPNSAEIDCASANYDKLLRHISEKNVLLQMSRLKQYPGLQEQCDRNELQIHGWMYTFEEGTIDTYNSETKTYVPLCTKGNKPQKELNYSFLLNCLNYFALIAGSSLLLIGLLFLSTPALITGGCLLTMNIGYTSYSFFTSRHPKLFTDAPPCDAILARKA